ncbi:MAG: hypothetical protein QM778_21405 [Myxococcales bacterium]
MARNKKAVLGGMLMLACACGDSASVGDNRTSCLGEKISCELPEEFDQGVVDPSNADVTPTIELLDPTWSVPLGNGSIAAGTNGTVWEISAGGAAVESFHVRQLRDDGAELGTLDIPPPEPKHGCRFDADVANSGAWLYPSNPGPVFFTTWYNNCAPAVPQNQIEAYALKGSVQEGFSRTMLAQGNPAPFNPRMIQRPPGAEDFAVLSVMDGWFSARVDARGEVLWQQNATVSVSTPQAMDEFETMVAFGGADQLLLVGRFGVTVPSNVQDYVQNLTTYRIDWNTGNVLSQRVDFMPWPQYKTTIDSRNRLVVAATNGTGDIEWLRIDGTVSTRFTMVRSSYTLMSVHALQPDAFGGAYLLTSTGDRGADETTLCYLSDTQQVSCALTPLLEMQMIAVSDQRGVVYGVHSDEHFQRHLVRYDFPL